MDAQLSAILAPSDIETRRDLITALATTLPFDRHLRAFLYYCDIACLHNFAARSQFDDSQFYVRATIKHVRDCIKTWMRRVRLQGMGSSPGSGSSSPFQRSLTLSPSSISCAAISRGRRLNRFMRRSTTRSREVNETHYFEYGDALEQVRSRDRHCIVTREDICSTVHIYPLYMSDPRMPFVEDVWVYLNAYFPSSASAWKAAIFTCGDDYIETGANLVAFNPLVHRYYSQAYFALRPLRLSDDRKTLSLQFFWLHQDEEYACDPDYRREPELFRPEHIDGRARGPKTSALLDHQADGCVAIASGSIITLNTPDPELLPLPDWHILDMQWKLQLLCAASCEGVVSAGESDPSIVPSYDGLWEFER